MVVTLVLDQGSKLGPAQVRHHQILAREPAHGVVEPRLRDASTHRLQPDEALRPGERLHTDALHSPAKLLRTTMPRPGSCGPPQLVHRCEFSGHQRIPQCDEIVEVERIRELAPRLRGGDNRERKHHIRSEISMHDLVVRP